MAATKQHTTKTGTIFFHPFLALYFLPRVFFYSQTRMASHYNAIIFATAAKVQGLITLQLIEVKTSLGALSKNFVGIELD